MPLHIILGCVEIIRNNHDDPEMLQKCLDVIKISGKYMMSLFDWILNEKCCNGENQDGCCEGYSISPRVLKSTCRKEWTPDMYRRRASLLAASGFWLDDMEINREIAAEMLKQTGAAT